MRIGATLTFVLGWLLVTAAGARAQESQPSEHQVKAAFIFNFAKFIDWPPAAFPDVKAPLVIGVFGDKPFFADLERAVQGKIVNARTVLVKECQTIEEAAQCQILFIGASEKGRLPKIFAGLVSTNVVTISEDDGFIKAGGAINFFREGKRIRFEINDELAKRASFRIDSKLLGLSKKPT
jgi:hypothetical protein